MGRDYDEWFKQAHEALRKAQHDDDEAIRQLRRLNSEDRAAHPSNVRRIDAAKSKTAKARRKAAQNKTKARKQMKSAQKAKGGCMLIVVAVVGAMGTLGGLGAGLTHWL